MNDSFEEICWMSAEDIASSVRSRTISPSDVAKAFVDRIENINPVINAIIEYDPDRIISDARDMTDRLSRGEDLGPLGGVPYTLKEGCAKLGTSAAGGLVPAKGKLAAKDSAVAARLAKAGGLYLGKTNQAEAGYSASSKNHLYGATRNPWNLSMTAGGSSSGAGAAVASGISPLAQGSDGGGSVRIPASLNGVVGFKPSIGRVPVAALSGRFYTFVFNGTLTRTVRDTALMLDVVSGPDSSDPLSLPPEAESYLERLTGTDSNLGWRIAYTPDFGSFEVDPEIAAICYEAVSLFKNFGCQIDHIDPGFEHMQAAMWNGIWAPTYASLHDAYDWAQYDNQVDPQLIELIEYGSSLSINQRNVADAQRGILWDRFADLMTDYDLIVSPTLTDVAFSIDQFAPDRLSRCSLATQLLGWLMTYPFNMLGTPSISIPAGWTRAGLPVGLQISGRLHADMDVLRAAAAFERASPWAGRQPSAID